jgi:hypothetical protein
MTTVASRPANHRFRQPWYRILYVQVLIAVALGVFIGFSYPDLGKELKPLGDGFIALIKMMIATVIFCTVVHGISSMGDLKSVGRGRAEGADLFRGGLDGRACRRPDCRRNPQARRRLQHRPIHDRSEIGRDGPFFRSFVVNEEESSVSNPIVSAACVRAAPLVFDAAPTPDAAAAGAEGKQSCSA